LFTVRSSLIYARTVTTLNSAADGSALDQSVTATTCALRRVDEASPYREYRTQLAGRHLAEALTRGAGFLSVPTPPASRAARAPQA